MWLTKTSMTTSETENQAPTHLNCCLTSPWMLDQKMIWPSMLYFNTSHAKNTTIGSEFSPNQKEVEKLVVYQRLRNLQFLNQCEIIYVWIYSPSQSTWWQIPKLNNKKKNYKEKLIWISIWNNNSTKFIHTDLSNHCIDYTFTNFISYFVYL